MDKELEKTEEKKVEQLICPKCGSKNIEKIQYNTDKFVYQCMDCLEVVKE